MNCFYCKQPGLELRPYGPDGEPICFKCAFETPERKATTERQFSQKLDDAARITNIAVLTPDGPIPFIHRKKKL